MLKWITVCAGLFLLTGCMSLQLRADDRPYRLDIDGLASGYASLSGIRPWDGKIVDIGVLSSSREDAELVSVEIWPLMEVGVGLVGMRAKVLPFEAGFGALFYHPEPHDYIDHGDHDVRVDVDVE